MNPALKCDDVQSAIDALDRGQAPDDPFRAHIDACERCRAYSQAAANLAEGASGLPAPALERDLWPAIESRIQGESNLAGGPLRPSHLTGKLLPLAAALVLMIGAALVAARLYNDVPYSPVDEARIHVVTWEDVIAASRQRADEVLAARADMMPEASQVALAENLEQLEIAIQEIRQAIDEHPEHPKLEVLLAARVQQHARLIQRISHV